MAGYLEAQSRYLATHAERDLEALFREALKLARRYADRLGFEVGDDVAADVVLKYRRENGFHVANPWAYIFRAVYNRGMDGTKTREVDTEIGGEDPREVSDRIADVDDPVYYIDDLLDHPQGRWLVVRLYQARSIRRACLDAEAAGVSRAWLRDHARQVVGVWRALHGRTEGSGNDHP